MHRRLTPYFLAVRDCINAEDPYDLRESGVPDDEYDEYVDRLVKWREPVTPERVLEALGDIPQEQAERLAAAIERVRPQG